MERYNQEAVIVYRFGLETLRSMWDRPPKVVEIHPGGLPDTD